MDTLIRIIADGLVVAIFVIAIATLIVRIPRDKWVYWAWRVIVAGLLTYALAKGIAAVYQPELLRPFEKLGVDPGAAYLPNPGFPSDHALFATFLTVTVWVTTQSKRLTIVLAVLTILMSIGRVVALVHTPLDVIGGMVIGLSSIVWYRLLVKK